MDHKNDYFDGQRSPCYKCADRSQGCHGSCERYAAFDRERKKVQHRRKLEFDVSEAISGAVRRMSGRREI